MNFIYEDNRIYVEDNNNVIAEINFYKKDNDTYDILRTYVNPRYRGKKVASMLVMEAVKYIKSKGYNVTASCSYAKMMIDKIGDTDG